MKNTLTLALAGTMLISASALISCATTSASASATVTPPAANAKMETVHLALSGLHWASGCPPRVQAALLKVNGVSSATATKTSATVVVDRNKVTNAQLIAAVKAAGSTYNATIK